jgi:hypothetical protein
MLIPLGNFSPLRGSLIAFLCDGGETALGAVSQPSHKNSCEAPQALRERGKERFPTVIHALPCTRAYENSGIESITQYIELFSGEYPQGWRALFSIAHIRQA